MPPRRRFSFVRITAARDWAFDNDSVLVLNGFIRPVHISRDKVPKCRHHLLFSGHALLPQGRRRSPLDRDFQRRGEKRISKPNLAEKYEAMKLKSTTVLSMLIRDGFYLGIFRKRIAGREILFLLSTHAAAKFKRFFLLQIKWTGSIYLFSLFSRDWHFPKYEIVQTPTRRLDFSIFSCNIGHFLTAFGFTEKYFLILFCLSFFPGRYLGRNHSVHRQSSPNPPSENRNEWASREIER